MSIQNPKSLLLLVLAFFVLDCAVSLSNQVLLGNNPTVALLQNLAVGAFFGVLALAAWLAYRKILGGLTRQNIVNIVDPRTGITVIAFFAFATILGALDRYNGMGISHLVTILSIGPLLVAFSTGAIPLAFWRRRGGWRSK